MSTEIRNLYCVGRNYAMHAAELGNAVPEEPMIFLKPTHAALPFAGVIAMPAGVGEVHHETELIIRIGAEYAPGKSVDELVDGVAYGIDFTLRDVQNVLKSKGHPWTKAKGFLRSAPMTPFRPFPGVEELAKKQFSMQINGRVVQQGSIRDMIFNLQTIVDYVASKYGLGPGDVIFTGTPAGVGPVQEGDVLTLFENDEELGKATITFA